MDFEEMNRILAAKFAEVLAHAELGPDDLASCGTDTYRWHPQKDEQAP